MVRLKGFEPLTFALEGHCSIQLSYKRKFVERANCPTNYGAGEGNRTLATSLEGWGSTTELHPHNFCDFKRISHYIISVNKKIKNVLFFKTKWSLAPFFID